MFKSKKEFMTIDEYCIDQINLSLRIWEKDKELSQIIMKNLIMRCRINANIKKNYQIRKYITGD